MARRADLGCRRTQLGTVKYYRKSGSGPAFENPISVGYFTDSAYAMDIAVADFDNDGNEDFLISGHRGVKDNLAHRLTFGAEPAAFEDYAV